MQDDLAASFVEGECACSAMCFGEKLAGADVGADVAEDLAEDVDLAAAVSGAVGEDGLSAFVESAKLDIACELELPQPCVNGQLAWAEFGRVADGALNLIGEAGALLASLRHAAGGFIDSTDAAEGIAAEADGHFGEYAAACAELFDANFFARDDHAAGEQPLALNGQDLVMGGQAAVQRPDLEGDVALRDQGGGLGESCVDITTGVDDPGLLPGDAMTQRHVAIVTGDFGGLDGSVDDDVAGGFDDHAGTDGAVDLDVAVKIDGLMLSGQVMVQDKRLACFDLVSVEDDDAADLCDELVAHSLDVFACDGVDIQRRRGRDGLPTGGVSRLAWDGWDVSHDDVACLAEQCLGLVEVALREFLKRIITAKSCELFESRIRSVDGRAAAHTVDIADLLAALGGIDGRADGGEVDVLANVIVPEPVQDGLDAPVRRRRQARGPTAARPSRQVVW